ncbi:hypothetical protein HUJ05_008749 [Dendroctonus ponderosae]|nr:hypothetical protein HUJ05_008749 [Dendroctonus ponderosae]
MTCHRQLLVLAITNVRSISATRADLGLTITQKNVQTYQIKSWVPKSSEPVVKYMRVFRGPNQMEENWLEGHMINSKMLTKEFLPEVSSTTAVDIIKGDEAVGEAISHGVKAKVVPRTSALTEQSYTGVNPEDSYRDISYRPGSKTVGFSKKSVLKYRSEEKKKVHFSVGEDEFQNGLEGPVGKPMRHSSEIISDFCWDDSQQPYSVSVKPVSQLKDVKLESISKKHKAISKF